MTSPISTRVSHFTESVIREMTRVNNVHNAINLAQGFPDFASPPELIQAAKDALDKGFNQYSITWGAPSLRRALADKFAWFNGLEVDPERHITVTCGSTEAMVCTMLALVNPDDEVIIIEPFYENYGPDTLLSGGTPVYVSLHQQGDAYNLSPDELRLAFTSHTKAIIVNTPHNPTGKVFTKQELQLIADLCIEHNVIAITDEPYEHLVFDGLSHHSLASFPGMAKRTVTLNSVSKTYSVTGWRVGWAITTNDEISTAIRRAHDFITVGAAHPLQEASAIALRFPLSYYTQLGRDYQVRRDTMLAILRDAGFSFVTPKGAYYVIARYPDCGIADDVRFATFMSEKIGVTPVPGSAFYHNPSEGKHLVRIAFPKKPETLNAIRDRLAKLTQYRKS